MSAAQKVPNAVPMFTASVPAGAVVATTHVHINIGKLSLHGYNPSQQRRFMQALQSALRQHAAEHGEWSSLSNRHLAQLPALQARPGMSPEDAAKKLVRQLFDRLDQRDAEQNHV
ncbi:hypothetical protein [Rhodanobacter sp. C05]|uniref:hypothetical protein n=1 Tax=Rhodanobacter sp. C05 TaxID=1945855 RepID=UPI000987BF66|nr:hypothetical protein [Rhodanobacter sp. C05]OOG37429.1 hypothetical protein B0E51_16375 [Rhodanobacter sp. C05]